MIIILNHGRTCWIRHADAEVKNTRGKKKGTNQFRMLLYVSSFSRLLLLLSKQFLLFLDIVFIFAILFFYYLCFHIIPTCEIVLAALHRWMVVTKTTAPYQPLVFAVNLEAFFFFLSDFLFFSPRYSTVFRFLYTLGIPKYSFAKI